MEENKILKNLVYVYFLACPKSTSKDIFEKWYKDSVLAEYTRPEFTLLDKWITEFRLELYGN